MTLQKKLKIVRDYLETWKYHCPYLRIRKYKDHYLYTWEENHTDRLNEEEFETLYNIICERIREDNDGKNNI